MPTKKKIAQKPVSKPAVKSAPVKKPAAKKTAAQKSNPVSKRLIAGGCLLIVLLLIIVCRGWLRVTVLPKALTPFYKNGVQNTLVGAVTDLQYPLYRLGYPQTNPGPVLCNLQQAQSIHTEISCNSEMLVPYAKLPASPAGQAMTENQAQKVQALLLKNGWKGGSNGVTLTSLIDGTYRGIDYSADAFYEKVIGSDDCVFDVMIAYANPQPPATRASLSCTRTVNILGAPSGEFYTSSRGHY